MALYALLRSNKPSATADRINPALFFIPSFSILPPSCFVMCPFLVRPSILSSTSFDPSSFHTSPSPGIVMALYALLRSNPSATAEEIEEGLDGNLCRCTGERVVTPGGG